MHKHPEYASESRRLLTFKTWNGRNQAELLSMAGFFYMGYGDKVCCFHCDGCLRNWEKEDDPFVEHVHWYPQCSFIRSVYGDEFFSQIQSQKANRSNLDECGNFKFVDHEIKNHMELDIVHKVLDMGYDYVLVHNIISNQLKNKGEYFYSVEMLLKAILEEKRESEYKLDKINHNEIVENIKNLTLEDKTNLSGRRYEAIPLLDVGYGSENTGTQNKNVDNVESLSEEEDRELVQTVSSSSIQNLQENDTQTMTHEVQSLEKHTERNENCANSLTSNPSHVDEHQKQDLSLLEENRKLKDRQLCKICMGAECNITFLPCGHFCSCVNCACKLEFCTICRALIKLTVKTYFS